MLLDALRTAHIAILGYWLGSELVINSTYRYVCYSSATPFPERDRLMRHVMGIDQHVRFALVMQAGTGVMLAALYGYVPGRLVTAWTAAIAMLLWLVFIEVIHRLRLTPIGVPLAIADRASRYLLMAAFLAVSVKLLGGSWTMPDWLRIKLALFAGVIACGVGIRWQLIAQFRLWSQMVHLGADARSNAALRRIYVRATGILVVLWLCIAGAVGVSVLKP